MTTANNQRTHVMAISHVFWGPALCSLLLVLVLARQGDGWLQQQTEARHQVQQQQRILAQLQAQHAHALAQHTLLTQYAPRYQALLARGLASGKPQWHDRLHRLGQTYQPLTYRMGEAAPLPHMTGLFHTETHLNVPLKHELQWLNLLGTLADPSATPWILRECDLRRTETVPGLQTHCVLDWLTVAPGTEQITNSVVPVSHEPAIPDIGRLFFTPEQRAALDRPTPVQVATPQQSKIQLQGYLIGHDGALTAWVNGQGIKATPQGSVRGLQRGRVQLVVEGQPLSLKPGEQATVP